MRSYQVIQCTGEWEDYYFYYGQKERCMEQISRDDRLILQLIERLTRVETKLDTMLGALEKSNERFIAIDESFMDLTDRVTKVESEASRANLRLDESKATIVKVGTLTSTAIGLLINALGIYLSHK